MAEVDKELAKLLTIAKKKPLNFGLVSKTSNVLQLIVSKKPIKDAELAKAKRELDGNGITKGVVSGGDGPELVFQVTEKSAVGDVKLRKYVTETAGLMLKTTFQVVETLAEIDDDSPDEDAPGPARPTSGEVPPPPPPLAETKEFVERFKKLQPGLAKVVESNVAIGSVNLGTEAAARAESAKDAAGKKDLPAALKLLGEAEKLVEKGLELLAKSTSGEDQAAQFKARLARLHPEVKARLAAGGETADKLKQKIGLAAAAVNEKNWKEAGELLDEVEALLKAPSTGASPTKSGVESPPVPPPPVPRPPRPVMAPDRKLVAALRALGPDITQAVAAFPDRKAEIVNLRSSTDSRIKAGEFDQAEKSLEELRNLLASLGGVSFETATDFREQWSAAVEEWETAVATVSEQMAALGTVLAKSDDEDLQTIAEFGLPAVTQNHMVPLRAALLELNATGPNRLKSAGRRVKNLLGAFRSHVESSPMVAACDENPFDVKVTIRQTLAPGFDALERGLAPLLAE